MDKTAGCSGTDGRAVLYKKTGGKKLFGRWDFYGKFIYLMDAYEDLPNDLEKGCYNPLKKIAEEERI